MPKERSKKRLTQRSSGQPQRLQHKTEESRHLQQSNQRVREGEENSREARRGQEGNSPWHIPQRLSRQELSQGPNVRKAHCSHERGRSEESEKLQKRKDIGYRRRRMWKSTSPQNRPQVGGRQVYASPVTDDIKRKDDTITVSETKTTQGKTGQSKQIIKEEKWTGLWTAGTLRHAGARKDGPPTNEGNFFYADTYAAITKKGESNRNLGSLLREAKIEVRTTENKGFTSTEAQKVHATTEDLENRMCWEAGKEDILNASRWRNISAETGFWRVLSENKENKSSTHQPEKTFMADRGENISTAESGETASIVEGWETVSGEESGAFLSTEESGESAATVGSDETISTEEIDENVSSKVVQDVSEDLTEDGGEEVSSQESMENVIVESSEEDTTSEDKSGDVSAKVGRDYVCTKEGRRDIYAQGKQEHVSTEDKKESDPWDLKEWEPTTKENEGEKLTLEAALKDESSRPKQDEFLTGDKWDTFPASDEWGDSHLDEWGDSCLAEWDEDFLRDKLERLSLASDQRDSSSSQGHKDSPPRRKFEDIPSRTSHKHASNKIKWERQPLGSKQEPVFTRGKYSSSKFKQNTVHREGRRGRASVKSKYGFLHSRFKQEYECSGARGFVPSQHEMKMSSTTKQYKPTGIEGLTGPLLTEWEGTPSLTSVLGKSSGSEWDTKSLGGEWRKGNLEEEWKNAPSGSKEKDILLGSRSGDGSSGNQREPASAGSAWEDVSTKTGLGSPSLIKDETSTMELREVKSESDWMGGSSKGKGECVPPRSKENVSLRTKSEGTALKDKPSENYRETSASTKFKDESFEVGWGTLSSGSEWRNENSGELKFEPTKSKIKRPGGTDKKEDLVGTKWSEELLKTKDKLDSRGTASKNVLSGTGWEMHSSDNVKDESFGTGWENLHVQSDWKDVDYECEKKDTLRRAERKDKFLKNKGEYASSGTVEKDAFSRTRWGNKHSGDTSEGAFEKPMKRETSFIKNKWDGSSKSKGRCASPGLMNERSETGWGNTYSLDYWEGASRKPTGRGAMLKENKWKGSSKTKGDHTISGAAQKQPPSGTEWGKPSDKETVFTENKRDRSSETKEAQKDVPSGTACGNESLDWGNASLDWGNASSDWGNASGKSLDKGAECVENKWDGVGQWKMEDDKCLKLESRKPEVISKSERPVEATFPKKRSIRLYDCSPVLPPEKPKLEPEVVQKCSNLKTRLFITSTHLPVLQAVSECIIQKAKQEEQLVKGPRPMRNKRLNVTVRRSPNGQGSKTWDHFVMIVHKRIIDIYSSPLITQRIIYQVSQEHKDMHKVHIKVSATV